MTLLFLLGSAISFLLFIVCLYLLVSGAVDVMQLTLSRAERVLVKCLIFVLCMSSWLASLTLFSAALMGAECPCEEEIEVAAR